MLKYSLRQCRRKVCYGGGGGGGGDGGGGGGGEGGLSENVDHHGWPTTKN